MHAFRGLSQCVGLALLPVLCAAALAQEQVQPVATLAAKSHAAVQPSAEDAKLHTDWADLGKYRQANIDLGQPKAGQPRVVFFGNSITEHWGQKNASGLSETGDYLASKHYINRGISGQTTPQMLVRFRQDVIDLKPDVLVVLAGTNDIAGNTGPMRLEQTEENITTMVELAELHHTVVILCSVTPANAFWWAPKVRPAESIVTLNGWIKQFAADHHLLYVNYYSALTNGDGGIRAEYSGDGVHPNSEGYAVMQPLVEAAIEKAAKERH